MFYIIAYDTPSNKRRRRLAKALEGFAVRVQKSVFETHLDKDQYYMMVEKAVACIDEKEDNLRIYEIPKDHIPKLKIYGKISLVPDSKFYYVGQNDEP